MRAGRLFGQTLRQAPADAETASHALLVRGAFLRQAAAGVYAWLPLGYRVLRKVSQIVREEMDREGAVELLMPILQPGELWKRSGRWEAYGPVLYRIEDRSGRDFCLAPTHEEMITFLASTELPSYKDLPSIAYHLQWKFRDEPRARGGLLRGREFYMADAYSFDADQEGVKASYARMERAFHAVFARCGLDVVSIEADPGAIGGTTNHEFTQPCPSGEDTYVACSSCDYAANTEVASGRPAEPYVFGQAPDAPEKVHTPGAVTVEQVAELLGVAARQLVKSLLFEVGGELVCALVPGDRELDERKLRRALDGADATLLGADGFEARGIAKGFSGPVGLGVQGGARRFSGVRTPGLDGVRIVADRSLEGASNLVTGANEADHHLTGVVVGRDFSPEAWADLVVIREGDRCERCGGELTLERGIEVGHIFQLGTRYSKALDATFADADGSSKPFLMGCYGLGVSRTVASIVEVHHDERGITWPKAVAPYGVVVILLSDDEEAVALAEDLESALGDEGVVLDDRAVSAGVKFADADLIGYPLQIVVGRSYASSGRLEAKVRATGERSEIAATPEAVRGLLGGCP